MAATLAVSLSVGPSADASVEQLTAPYGSHSAYNSCIEPLEGNVWCDESAASADSETGNVSVRMRARSNSEHPTIAYGSAASTIMARHELLSEVPGLLYDIKLHVDEAHADLPAPPFGIGDKGATSQAAIILKGAISVVGCECVASESVRVVDGAFGPLDRSGDVHVLVAVFNGEGWKPIPAGPVDVTVEVRLFLRMNPESGEASASLDGTVSSIDVHVPAIDALFAAPFDVATFSAQRSDGCGVAGGCSAAATSGADTGSQQVSTSASSLLGIAPAAFDQTGRAASVQASQDQLTEPVLGVLYVFRFGYRAERWAEWTGVGAPGAHSSIVPTATARQRNCVARPSFAPPELFLPATADCTRSVRHWEAGSGSLSWPNRGGRVPVLIQSPIGDGLRQGPVDLDLRVEALASVPRGSAGSAAATYEGHLSRIERSTIPAATAVPNR